MPAFGALEIRKPARLASASALVSGRPKPVPPEPQRAEVASWTERLERGRDILLAHADAGVAHAQYGLAIVRMRR